MRQVDNRALQTMTSPIRHVMRHIHEAIVNVAPERKTEFDATYDEFTLEYVDDHRWICDVHVPTKHIRVSRKVVEVLWASSFAYFRLYQRVQEVTGGRASVSAEIEFENDPNLKQATDLLRWAIDSWVNRSDEPWPDSLPQPTPDPPHASDEHVADELCLCAVAVFMHHELAHILLRHEGRSELDSERDADIAASSWVFDQLDDEEDAKFVKRSLGLAVAMEVLVARGMHIGSFGGVSHPRSFDRLINALDRHIQDPNHPAWFFVAVILKLHLDNAEHGATIPEGPFNSGRQCVDAYVDALSRIDA